MAEITKELGRVPISRGEFNLATTYYKDNIVQYQYASYQVTAESITGVAPVSPEGVVNTGWIIFGGSVETDKINKVLDHGVLTDNWDEQDDDPEDYDPLAVTEASYTYNWKTTDAPASDGKTEGNLKDLYQKTLNQDSKLLELEGNLGVNSRTLENGWSEYILYNVYKGTTYKLTNYGDGNILSVQLKGISTQEINTNLSPNESIEFTALNDASSLRIYAQGILRYRIEIKDNDVIKEIEKVKSDVADVQNKIGVPIVFSTPGSGWTDYIEVNAIAGDKILIKSLDYRIDYINYYNDDDNPIKSWEPTDVQVGVETLITLSIDAKRIKLYAMGVTDITLYKSNVVKTSLEDAKQSIGVINGITEVDFKPLRGVSNIMINGDAGHYLKSYSAWRFGYFYYNSGGYIFKLTLEGYRDNEWGTFDMIEWLNGEEHQFNAVDIVKGKLGFFEVYVNWSALKEGSYPAINQEIRKQCIDYALIDEKNSVTNAYLYGDFERKDYIKHTIVVDVGGNGDFTTINDAYLSIKDSGYRNQYEIVVMEGIYNEYNLVPPEFTHTYGIGNVIVTSEGKTDTLPVFDQKNISKLSNLKIVSATGYCIHQDFSGLEGIILKNENLYCKKVYGADVRNHGWTRYSNPSILGIGSHKKGARFVYKNCVFEDGECGSHTVGNGTKYGNQHIVYNGCKFINSYVWLGVAGSVKAEGEYVCEMSNCVTKVGDYSVKLKYGVPAGSTVNFPWMVIGAGNKNFSPVFDNSLDNNTGNLWSAVNTDSISFAQLASGVSVTEGQWVDVDGNICTNDTNNVMIHGVALTSMSADSREAVRLYIGNAYPYTAPDGEYGIGDDGKLSLNVLKKIGVVKNNIFYRTL